jgi:glycosyltransferase involved in cell wall biosynthesis
VSLALNTVVCDEEYRIKGLLNHAARFCDELVVIVDENSTDGTFDLALDFGATTVLGPHSWYCEPLRPLAAAYTRSDWILCLDGDEVIAEDKLPTLLALDRERWKAVKLPRLNLIDGVQTTESLDSHIRLFERGYVRYGLTPHSRIEAIGDKVWWPQTPGWIIHSKSHAEWQSDHLRTEANT